MDNGAVNDKDGRVGMFYKLSVNEVNDSLTLGVEDAEFTITGLGEFDITTTLTYLLLGKSALGDIPSDVTVKSGSVDYIVK